MADTGTDFITFLKANYPDDYNKLSADNVANSLINAIINKHQSQFEIWKKVPERIREEYNGRVPHDILEAAKTDNNLTIGECRKIEADRTDNNNHYQSSSLNNDFPIAAPSSLLAHAAFKNMLFTASEREKIVHKAQSHRSKGYSRKSSVDISVLEEANIKLEQDLRDGKITDEEARQARNENRKKRLEIAKKDIQENQPERIISREFIRALNTGKLTEEEARQQLSALTEQVKKLGREEQLIEKLVHKGCLYRKLDEKSLQIFNEECLSKISNIDFASLRESTPDNTTFKDSILNKLAFEYLKDQEKVSNKQEENSATSAQNKNQYNTSLSSENKNKNQNTEDTIPLSVRNNIDKRICAVKQEWIDNQPEKMLVHIAKELNRGKIDKDTALPQMDVLMKKVKTMGREQELEAYLKQPQAGYSRFNEDNKILFNELMLSHDVGSVAQTLNKVRTKNTKEAETQEQNPQQKQVVTPTKDISLTQLKQINNRQER